MTQRDDAPGPRSLAELFAKWGEPHLLNPHEPRAFIKLAARYADLLQLIHRHEAALSEKLPTRDDALALLIEWQNTELDMQDEEFEPWIQSFNERIDALKAAPQVSPEHCALSLYSVLESLFKARTELAALKATVDRNTEAQPRRKDGT